MSNADAAALTAVSTPILFVGAPGCSCECHVSAAVKHVAPCCSPNSETPRVR